MATLNVYQRADGRWAWNLKARNGNILATDGGQGYENEADCRTIAEHVTAGTYTLNDPITRK